MTAIRGEQFWVAFLLDWGVCSQCPELTKLECNCTVINSSSLGDYFSICLALAENVATVAQRCSSVLSWYFVMLVMMGDV